MENQAADNSSASPAKSNSSSAQNSSAGPIERRNFMKPQFENALEKREKFAVNLRKKKTQEIVKAKRRKIVEALESKGKTQGLQGLNGTQVEVEVKGDADLSVVEMLNQSYFGYPEWRKNEYDGQKVLLEKMATPADWEAYATSGYTQKVQFLLNLLTQQSHEAIGQLALVTKVRQEFSNGQETPHIDEILSQTTILTVISQILGVEDGTDLTRYLQLEATWILTNLAYGSEQDLLTVLDPKFAILCHLNRILAGNDLQQVDQVYFALSNMMLTSTAILKMVTANINIFDSMTKVCDIYLTNINNGVSIGSYFINQMLYCMDIMTRNSKKLDQKHVPKIMAIVVMLLRSPKDGQWSQYFMIDEIDNLVKILDALSHRMDAGFMKAVNDSKVVIPFAMHLLNWNSPVYWRSPERTVGIVISVLEFIGNCVSVDSVETVHSFISHGIFLKLANFLGTGSSKIVKLAAWIYSNLVTSGDQKTSELFIDQFLAQGPIEKIATLTASGALLDDQGDWNYDIAVQRESLWVMSNCIACGSSKQRKDLYDLCTKEKIYDPVNGENLVKVISSAPDGTEYNQDAHVENILLKGMIRGIRTLQDAELLSNLLDALKLLFEVDEIYGMSLPNLNNDALHESVMEQFKIQCGVDALDACILRNSASQVSGEEESAESQKIFLLANEIHRVATKYNYQSGESAAEDIGQIVEPSGQPGASNF